MVAGSGACSHSAASPLGLECPRPVHPPPQPASARPPTRRLISSPLGTRCRPSQPPTARRARPAAACQTLNRGLAGTWPAWGGEHEGRQPVRCGEGGAVCVGVGGWGPVGGGGGGGGGAGGSLLARAQPDVRVCPPTMRCCHGCVCSPTHPCPALPRMNAAHQPARHGGSQRRSHNGNAELCRLALQGCARGQVRRGRGGAAPAPPPARTLPSPPPQLCCNSPSARRLPSPALLPATRACMLRM
mgnify:CR=1 FL=1